MRHEYNRAIVRVPDEKLELLSRGIVLPEGYRFAKGRPAWIDPMTQSFCFLVEGEDLPYVQEGLEPPSLFVLDGYDHIIVERYQT